MSDSENQSQLPAQRVLIADDDRTNRELLRGLLQKEGYEVDEAEDGEQVIAKATAQPPDLILLDVMMPRMDGYEVCATLKKQFGAERFVPIILLTALEDIASLERGFDAGADDFVSKPFEPRLLLARSGASLRAKRVWDELRATQEKLVEAEKMGAVGQLVVTLKHEINNPLQTIIGYGEYLLSQLEENNPHRSRIGAMSQAGERISEILKKLDQVQRIETTEYLGEGLMIDINRSIGED